jgi:hypothetical protein
MQMSERTRKVLRVATGPAEIMGDDYAGTGHVLLALLLERHAFTPRVSEHLSRLHGLREHRAPEGKSLSRPVKMAVGCALQEALLLGDSTPTPSIFCSV